MLCFLLRAGRPPEKRRNNLLLRETPGVIGLLAKPVLQQRLLAYSSVGV